MRYRIYMETIACVCSASALELYRSSRRLIPTLLEHPRTGMACGCSMPPAIMLSDEMTRAGVTTKPYHLLIDGDNAGHARSDVARHPCNRALPSRALIKLSNTLYVVSPEFLFLQLAASGDYDEIDLVQLGYELCGTYVLDNSWDGFTCIDTPLTSTDKIFRMLRNMPRHSGVAIAKRALKQVHDMSNSPMETVLAMLVSLPTCSGGLGLSTISMNSPVNTPDGPRRIDVLLREHKTGLEYKGKLYHSIEQSGRDDRRQNNLIGSGFSIINVWLEDLKQEHLFQQLIRDIFRTAKIRFRVRVKDFDTKQQLLRARLLPAIERLG